MTIVPRLMIRSRREKWSSQFINSLPFTYSFSFLPSFLFCSFINCFKASRIRYNHKCKNTKQVCPGMHDYYMSVIEGIVEVAFVPQLAFAQQS